MMKRMLSLLLCLAMLLSLAPTHVFAAEDGTEPSEETTVPTQSETEPVEETTVPTQSETEPVQETIADQENENQAADEVAALIEALPALEAIQAKPMEEQQADYNQVQVAYSAYEALTEEQKALLPSVEEIFGAYFDYFNGLTAPAYGIEEEEGTCGDDLTWKVDTTGTLTISGTGPMTDFADSESLPWQNNVLNIKTIVMDDTITTIGDYAFAGFWNLESVTLPQNLTKIGDYAFDSAGCSADSVSIDITIPSTLTQMGDYAFRNAKGLKQVVFENGITSIGYASFNNCTALTELVIPASVTQIADYAFETCTNVASITFMGNAPSFGQVIFRNITANVYYPVNNSTWTSDIMQNYGGTLSWLGTDLCAQGHNYIDNVCSACGMITGTAASGSVRWTLDSEGKLSVYKTGDMSDYNINNSDLGTYYTSVTSIHYEEGAEIICVPCISSPILTSIVFPDTTKTIYFRSVSYLPESLTELTIPASVTSIHTEEPYYGPDNYLIRVNVDEDNEVYTSVDGVVYSADMTKLVYYPRCHSAESYTVPETVNSLEHGFINCDNLSVIQFTGNAPTMEEFFNGILAFNCTEATIIYPAGDTTWDSLIGKNFAGKLKWQDSEGNLLTSGSFGTNITWSFDQKETLTISGTGAMQDLSDFMCSGEGRNIAPDVPWLGFVSQIKTVIFEGAITNIGSYTFGNSTKYNYDIQDVFFQGTEEEFTAALKDENSALIAENVTLHCIEATGTCGENVTWILEHGGYLTVSGTGAMYDYASDTEQPWGAYQDSIQSVVIEDGVTSIGAYAFANCAALTSVTMTDSVETIGSHAFYDCTTLSSIDLSDSLTELSNSVFGYCKALESIVVPNKVTTIGENTFNATSKLTQITLGESVAVIGGWAFQSSSITEITIPATVISISGNAFMNCTQLTTIAFEGNAPTFGSNAFYNVTATASYPAYNDTWTDEKRQDYGGKITWSEVAKDLPVDESNFPDENFRNFILSQSYGADGVLTQEELAGVKKMYVAYKDIKSLKGIEYFSVLTELDCSGNQLTELDVGSNPALTVLGCDGNQLTTLDVSNNPVLEKLTCENNELTKLDVSKNPALEKLVCSVNELTELDVNGDLALTDLYCAYNQLTTLDVTQNPSLTDLYCAYNQLTTLDVTQNSALIELVCYSNQLTTLDVTENPALTLLSCANNQLTILDVSSNPALKTLACNDNELTELDVSRNLALIYLSCGDNQLTELDVSSNPALTVLWCDGSQLTALDVTENPVLTELWCHKNQLTTLDVSNNPALEKLKCGNNELTKLDVSKNPALTFLSFSHNQLTELDVSNNSALEELWCESNQLTTLDVSNNPALENLVCNNNELSKLDVSNNSTLSRLQCAYNQLTTLDVSGNSALTYLSCHTNNLTSLDLSGNSLCTSVGVFNNEKKIVLNGKNQFDLTTLPGFDTTKASNWAGGTVNDSILTATASTITYTYDLGNGKTETFTLTSVQENRVEIEASQLEGNASMWIDGVEYTVTVDGDNAYVDLPDSNAKTMVAYTYASDDSGDAQTQYPTGMTVWTLTNNSGIYTATRVEDLDNILQYSGMSIRVTGQKGIRMITSVEQTKKDSLTADGLAGYTLKEYGTVVAWASKLESGEPLTLGQSYTVSNYAYKKGIADPVFAYDGDLMQYTNVLVNFSDEQCKNDLALRPYMILEDAEGNEITLYGGIVTRSIGYIAYQNRDTFTAGTEAYEYIWDIIHTVYGDAYDEAYIA